MSEEQITTQTSIQGLLNTTEELKNLEKEIDLLIDSFEEKVRFEGIDLPDFADDKPFLETKRYKYFMAWKHHRLIAIKCDKMYAIDLDEGEYVQMKYMSQDTLEAFLVYLPFFIAIWNDSNRERVESLKRSLKSLKRLNEAFPKKES